MNIVVIGTSNSVMKNNYVGALQVNHNVINLSSGRNSIFYHIKTLIENYEIINSSDLLIIDHYVNDMQFYLNINIDDYSKHIENFYCMLKSLNVFTLLLFMPVLEHLKQKRNIEYLQFLKKRSTSLDISILDLNEYNFKKHHYEDKIHISRNISNLIGVLLSEFLSNNEEYICSIRNGKLNKSPYFLYTSKDAVKFNKELTLTNYKNSLLSINYINIDEKQTIKVNLDKKFAPVSYGYFIPRESKDTYAFTIISQDNEIDVLCIGKLYYHEAFIELLGTVDEFLISSFNKSNIVVKNIRGKKVMFPSEFNFVEMLFYDKSDEVTYELNNAKKINIQLKTLNNILDNVLINKDHLFFNMIDINNYESITALLNVTAKAFEMSKDKKISRLIVENQDTISKTINLNECKNIVNTLVIIAFVFETMNDIETAYIIMEKAMMLRPDGVFLIKKYNEYKLKLNKNILGII